MSLLKPLLYLMTFVAGFAFLPTLIYMKLPLPRQTVGRILFTLGQVTWGGSIAEDRGHSVELHPFDYEEGIYHDGEGWVEIDLDAVYRLGLRPFAMVPSIDESSIGEYIDRPPETSSTADGGYVLLDRQSGGTRLFTQSDPGFDRVLFDAVSYIKSVGRSGNRMINRAEEQALRRFGGDSQMSDAMMLIAVMGGFLVMFISTWIMLSL